MRRREPKLTKDGLGVWSGPGLGGGLDVLAGAKGSKLRIERKDEMDDDGAGVCGEITVLEGGWLLLSEVRRKADETELRDGRGVTTGMDDWDMASSAMLNEDVQLGASIQRRRPASRSRLGQESNSSFFVADQWFDTCSL